ncbi:monosaccharide ABC transporter substrate-binding protein, CUT2 family [Faunimonas pinastri]|uniref:Monosaccharide ABC transporter substrate-binding protein, CUT2 family n=1 Tax=Faunimonas pinastri TaxID=1855383 RepID=A0A1H9Q0L7_9HYPH|nr:ABC transporter substrate-binding protein [Faunimonas pinastri]SER54001.1 monosaccharide ABC transporter substrate-binding protein, CUT2 family [Faunimonas pinastri]
MRSGLSQTLSGGLLAGIGALSILAFAASSPAFAASNCIKGDRKPPYKVGWANIYSVPTWMKQTEGTITKEVADLKKQGVVKDLIITDAQGNANTQIQQIQSMIDSNLDAIVVDAGSSTALDRVISDACDKGIAVVNFDSLVDTDKLTAKLNTDSNEWGRQAAQWMVDRLGGKGKIIIMNGPAGVSVSDDRRKGAQPVLDANKGIQVLTETNTEYNVAPAQEAMTSLLFSNPDIDGVLSLGGALSAGALLAFDRQGHDPVPITGENYRQFLELWKKEGVKGWATMQPNWLGALAVYTAVQALNGKDVPAYVKVPLPVIDDSNIGSYLDRSKDFPADGYIYSDFDTALFDKLLAQK